MSKPRIQCTRCRKRTDDPFIWQHVTRTEGFRELKLCPSCTKWSLVYILTTMPNAASNLLKQQDEVNAFLNDLERRKDKMVVHTCSSCGKAAWVERGLKTFVCEACHTQVTIPANEKQ